MVSNQVYEPWQPDLQHLIAPIATLNLDAGLQHSLGSYVAAVAVYKTNVPGTTGTYAPPEHGSVKSVMEYARVGDRGMLQEQCVLLHSGLDDSDMQRCMHDWTAQLP